MSDRCGCQGWDPPPDGPSLIGRARPIEMRGVSRRLRPDRIGSGRFAIPTGESVVHRSLV